MFSNQELSARLARLGAALDAAPHLPWIAGATHHNSFAAQLLEILRAAEGDNLHRHLHLLLSQDSQSLRSLAVQALCGRGDPHCVNLALSAIEDHHPLVRATAAWVLADLDDDESLEALLSVRDQDDALVKERVISTLESRRDARAIPLLVRWIGTLDFSDELRCRAACALGHIGDEAALPVLCRALADAGNTLNLRAASAIALGRLGCAEGNSELLRHTSDPQPEVCAAVLLGLALGRAGGLSPLATAAFRVRQPAIVRAAALEALCMVRRTGIMLARKALTDPAPEVRARAVRLIAATADSDAADLLTRATADQDAAVAATAQECLARLAGVDDRTASMTRP